MTWEGFYFIFFNHLGALRAVISVKIIRWKDRCTVIKSNVVKEDCKCVESCVCTCVCTCACIFARVYYCSLIDT